MTVLAKSLIFQCRLLTSLWLVLIITLSFSACVSTETSKEDSVDDVEAQLAVVGSYLDAGSPEKALREMRQLLEKYPNDARVQNMMGLTQLTLRNYSRAIQHFQKSFAVVEKISTGLNLSAALIEVGRYQEAEKILVRLSTKKEQPPYKHPERIFHNLGIVYERTNRIHLAEKNYKRSLEENPIYYLTRLQLARLYEKTRRSHLAIMQFEEAHAACPVCLEPVTELSKNYVRSNQKDKARKLVSKYLKTDGVSADDLLQAQELNKSLP